MLFLIVLGAASVKAQVRIGGNAAPNASALLDLNATDAANNGTKGLALPRVNLTSNTMLLSGVTANLTGMLVYNTTATLGAIGIYYWNGATWVKASLPSTSASDTGYMLVSNGSNWVAWRPWGFQVNNDSAINNLPPARIAQVSVVLDTSVSVHILNSRYTAIKATGIRNGDYCYRSSGGAICFLATDNNLIQLIPLSINNGVQPLNIRCIRFTF